METLVAPTINVLILVSVMVYFLRAPIKQFVAGRSSGLRDELLRVEAQLKDAEQKYNEFSAKLQAIDAEIAALREQVKQDSQAMKVNTIAEAKRMANSMLVDAKDSSQVLFGDLKNQLRSELSVQVLARAETILRERLTGDDKVRIRREFSQQVESVQ